MSARKVIIAAGGTGGHVFPGVSFAKELQKRGFIVEWIGTQNGLESKIVPTANLKLHYFKVSGIRGKGIASILSAPVNITKALVQARKILRSEKADLVVGMGGYVAGPVGLAAKLMGLPLIIHEQNSIPGTTNRLLAKVANKVFCAFDCELKGAVVVGNPVREEIAAIYESKRNAQGQAINILIFGGSRGARTLNTRVAACVAKLVKPLSLSVWHQSGAGRKEEAESSYKAEGAEVRVDEFIGDMAEAYAWADLVICRSGALTVSELMAAGVASILFPYPYAIDDHQTQNAMQLKVVGAASVIQERDLNEESFMALLNELLSNPAKLIEQGEKARSLFPGKTVDKLADAAEALCA